MVLRHALRNAIIVVLTIAGLQFGGLLAGSVIVESVFSRPGLGSFVVGAILGRDYPDIQGVVLVFAVLYVVINTRARHPLRRDQSAHPCGLTGSAGYARNGCSWRYPPAASTRGRASACAARCSVRWCGAR